MGKRSSTTASIFADYQMLPTGRMRYTLAQKNLSEMHDLTRPRSVLDAAGGNGLYTGWLRRSGHAVTLLDQDSEMLDQGRARMSNSGFQSRCRFLQSRIEDADRAVGSNRFDLIVCHHIIEYLDDPKETLHVLQRVATAGGELSLVTLNPVSEVIRAMVFRHDGALALSKLRSLDYDAKWFGKAKLYSHEQVAQWAAQAGWVLQEFRAIRVLADYIPDAEYDDARERQVNELEIALSNIEPYRRIGRYLQFCFKKAAA